MPKLGILSKWNVIRNFVQCHVRHAGFIWRVLKQSLKIPWINKIPLLTYLLSFFWHFLIKMV
nr:MAG TPA: hypothetical protein [Herelleviridae sp.]